MKVMVLPTQLSPVSGPFVWYGPEMAKRADWIRPLAPAEIAELEAAVQRLDATGIDVAEIGPDHLDVPGLGPLVEQIRRAVLKETGFILVRGVPVDRWSVRQCAIAYFGLGAMIGEPVSQNAKGHILGHVKDIGADYAKPTSRGYQTAARLPYHTDSSDIVALLCLKRSKAGGLSSIASSATIYNEMLKRRPDLAAELTGPVYRDRRGELPEGAEEWYAVPVFSPMPGGGLITTYVRSAMRKAQRFPAVPRTTPELEAACNLFDELAESPEIHLDMEFRLPALARAQQSAPDSWPTRSIRLVVAYAAGCTTDLLGRLVAGWLGSRLGQPVVVENRGGRPRHDRRRRGRPGRPRRAHADRQQQRLARHLAAHLPEPGLPPAGRLHPHRLDRAHAACAAREPGPSRTASPASWRVRGRQGRCASRPPASAPRRICSASASAWRPASG